MKVVRSIGSLSDDDLEKGMTEAQAIKEGIIIRDTVRVNALESVFGKDYPIDDLRYVPYTQRKHQFRMGAPVSLQTQVLKFRFLKPAFQI